MKMYVLISGYGFFGLLGGADRPYRAPWISWCRGQARTDMVTYVLSRIISTMMLSSSKRLVRPMSLKFDVILLMNGLSAQRCLR